MKRIDKLKEKMSVEKFNLLDVIFLIIIFSLISIAATTFVQRKNKISQATNSIDSVYNEILSNYYEDVDKEGLASSAIEGMMKYLNEKYSIYMGEDATNSLKDTLDGTYKGIGVVVKQSEGKLIIYNIFKNSPADKAGLQVDDQIVSLDDIKVTEETDLSEVVKYIREHNDIAFGIKRYDSDLLINVTTADIDDPVVSTKLLSNKDSNYGYIRLSVFSKSSSTQFKNSLEELEKNDIKGLIIDLRSNTGGYVEQAGNIAKMFTNKNKVIYSLKEKNEVEVFKDDDDEERGYPVVILVNSGTASAAELLSLSLKESYGAILVGTTTFGKGRIQGTADITNSRKIKLTTGKWYSPNNNNIDGVGIRPSYEVELTKDYYINPTDKNDSQLTKGLSVLVELTK